MNRALILIILLSWTPLKSWSAPTDHVGFSGARMSMACFPENGTDALSKYGTRVNPTLAPDYMSKFGAVLDRISMLGAGNNAWINNVTVNVANGGKSTGSSCASQTLAGKTITLVINCGSSQGSQGMTSHFEHEMGHIVGLQGGFYGRYFGANPPPPCPISGYALNNGNASPRNEEFAEIFASYLSSPDALKAICPRQFEWFHQNVFRGGPDPTEGCTGNPNPVDAEGPGGAGGFSEPPGRDGSFGSQMSRFSPLLNALYNLLNPQNRQPYYPPPLPILTPISPTYPIQGPPARAFPTNPATQH